LSKTRIFELYLNNIEWGDGIWGAEAAAQAYFGIPASAISADQAALMAGAIVNPRVLNIGKPNGRLRARQRIIRARMGQVTPPPVVAVPPPASTPENPDEPQGAAPVPDEDLEAVPPEPEPEPIEPKPGEPEQAEPELQEPNPGTGTPANPSGTPTR
jgi:monofunctional biosynthetic peptidoglycan transglycosylase